MNDDLLDDETVARLLEREIALAPPLYGVPAAPEQPVDLRTIVGELTALKSELRAETNASRKQRELVERALDVAERQTDGLARASDELGERVEAASARAERRGLEALIDVLDRLEAATRSAVERPRSWWHRRDPATDALLTGLGMTIDRASTHIEALGARRIDTRGAIFDPHHMQALATRSIDDREDGAVLEEITAGFLHRDRVLRAATVVVNRRAPK